MWDWSPFSVLCVEVSGDSLDRWLYDRYWDDRVVCMLRVSVGQPIMLSSSSLFALGAVHLVLGAGTVSKRSLIWTPVSSRNKEEPESVAGPSGTRKA